ncbi:MAG: hypothetical protein QOF62_2747 [Pyrinomonadaceae bacterium]|jgi:hypothetical protein|nr:hypothetical protein [Pyrinomonadaceae bacterium]
MLPQHVFPPISPILRDRKFTFALVGATGLHIALVSLNLPSWECPIFRLTGVPCPGCGLSRATVLLLKGDLAGSFRFHAFAPIFLFAIGALILSVLLPRSILQPAIARAELIERKTGLTVLILGGLILYWLARLLFLQADFVQLIRG